MNFLTALPSLFSSPLLRDTIGSIAGGAFNFLKNQASNALDTFLGNTKEEIKNITRPIVQPILKDIQEEYNEPMEEEENYEEERPNPRRRVMENQRRRRQSLGNRVNKRMKY